MENLLDLFLPFCTQGGFQPSVKNTIYQIDLPKPVQYTDLI